MNKIITHLFLLIPFLSFAQKADENYSPVQYRTETCRSSFAKVRLGDANSVATVKQYLNNNIVNLKDYRTGLKLNYVKESPGGFHYSFYQTFKGIEIYQTEIKVNIDRQLMIQSVFDNSENTASWNLDVLTAGPNSIIALRRETQSPVLCERIISNQSLEQLKANDEVIFERDLNSYFVHDTMVDGKVFMPDPLTSSQQNYGFPFVDNNDSTNSGLNNQLHNVKFLAGFNGSVFVLENSFVRVSDFDAPSIAPATSVDGHFDFNRSESGFEDVNAFYHINMMHSHIHSLGFNSSDGLVEIDPHAVGGADNSYFSPTESPNRIYYGTGGVDDAEDADVCVHEYGHFVSNGAAPGSNSGQQRNSIDEGFGDYLAASYSKSISTFHDDWVFNWDGHNEFWNGRIVNSTWKYPDDLSQTSIYHNGQIWSAILWCINGAIGRDATDSLILQAHYAYAQNISMPDAAQLLIDADTILTGGKYTCPIYSCLFYHGLAPGNPLIACSVGISETNDFPIQFLAQPNSFSVNNPSQWKIGLQLLNAQGQLIWSDDKSQSLINYSNANLPSGIYLVNVKVNGQEKTFKWTKF